MNAMATIRRAEQPEWADQMMCASLALDWVRNTGREDVFAFQRFLDHIKGLVQAGAAIAAGMEREERGNVH